MNSNRRTRSRFTIFLTILTSALLSGCANIINTQNLDVDDSGSDAVTLKAEYRINQRFGVAGSVSHQVGSAVETFDGGTSSSDAGADEEPPELEAIQLNGTRLIASQENPITLDYDFDLTVGLLSFDIYTVDSSWYQLILAPSASYARSNVDALVGGENFSLDQNDFQVGVQVRQDFALAERLNLSLDLSRHGIGSDNSFEQSSIDLEYRIFNNLNLTLGYSIQSVGDEDDTQADGCTAMSDPEDCSDSELLVSTQGFTFGLMAKF